MVQSSSSFDVIAFSSSFFSVAPCSFFVSFDPNGNNKITNAKTANTVPTICNTVKLSPRYKMSTMTFAGTINTAPTEMNSGYVKATPKLRSKLKHRPLKENSTDTLQL